MTSSQSFWAVSIVSIVSIVVLVLLIACYFDLVKQERERPKENWRGPFLVRYIKNLAAMMLDGVPSVF